MDTCSNSNSKSVSDKDALLEKEEGKAVVTSGKNGPSNRRLLTLLSLFIVILSVLLLSSVIAVLAVQPPRRSVNITSPEQVHISATGELITMLPP